MRYYVLFLYERARIRAEINLSPDGINASPPMVLFAGGLQKVDEVDNIIPAVIAHFYINRVFYTKYCLLFRTLFLTIF